MSALRIVTFKVEASVVEAMDRTARMLGLTRSELIREAILRYLSELGVEVEKGGDDVGGRGGDGITIILEG